ncbi:Chorismate mutase [Smittium culicis]|nr:Chorismate mutase [Smittium culicis]
MIGNISPDEYPFTKDLPLPVLPDLDYPNLLVKNSINVNDKIKDIYINTVIQEICEHGDDSNYGSSATRDIECLQALSRRIHYGKFVAESKFRDPKYHDTYVKLIKEQNAEAINELLTNEQVEKKLLDRLHKKALIYGQDFDALNFKVSESPSGSRPVLSEIYLNNPTVKDSEPKKNIKVDSSVVVDLYKTHVIPLTKLVEVEYLLHRLD